MQSGLGANDHGIFEVVIPDQKQASVTEYNGRIKESGLNYKVYDALANFKKIS